MTACLSTLCYVVQRRTQTALMIGDAVEMIDAYYVDPVDRDQLIMSAMRGMTESLDDHSEFIAEENYQAFQDSIQQEFAGIGIYVEQPEINQPVRVITPLVGSPALAAGLMPDDRILAVNGEDVSSMELQDVSKRLKGPVGTVISVKLLRGEDTLELNVRRERIEIESVIGDHRDINNQWIYRLADQPEIAYLRLTSFGDRTVKEVQAALGNLEDDYLGLIVDLRGNGGGLLNSAVEISDMFLEKGRIVSTRTRGGVLEDQFDANPTTLINPEIPVAILIDQDSASASEIVAACLQDHGRAVIVGKRSFGKGTVQNILPLQYGKSALRLTVARYYRPNGENIHRKRDASEEDQWGVVPNKGYEIALDPERLDELAKRWRESSYPSLARQTNNENTSETQETPIEPSGQDQNDDTNHLDTQLKAAIDAIGLSDESRSSTIKSP